MKGKEIKKEKKKDKMDVTVAKVQSDYQKDKMRKSTPDIITVKKKNKA